MKSALITGVTGQDGFHLTSKLLSLNYSVHGITTGLEPERLAKFQTLFPGVKIIKGDMRSIDFLESSITLANPDEIYNLAAVSSVAKSFEIPEQTFEINYSCVVQLTDVLLSKPRYRRIRLYQASSSEMFGNQSDRIIDEMSYLSPVSPYGESKAMAHELCKQLNAEGSLSISLGILFNHESEYRQKNFVSSKILDGAFTILNDPTFELRMGSMSARRDWGYAPDYVDAIFEMMQLDHGEDFVIATGKSHSVGDLIETVFIELGIEDKIESNVRSDEALFRKVEIPSSIGNSNKAKKMLGWTPTHDFQMMVSKIVHARKNDTESDEQKGNLNSA